MDRKAAERFTSPAVGIAVVVAAGIIAIRPDFSLIVLAIAEAIAGVCCAVLIRTTLKRTPPAPSGAIMFAVFALFWLGMAALSLMWYSQRM